MRGGWRAPTPSTRSGAFSSRTSSAATAPRSPPTATAPRTATAARSQHRPFPPSASHRPRTADLFASARPSSSISRRPSPRRPQCRPVPRLQGGSARPHQRLPRARAPLRQPEPARASPRPRRRAQARDVRLSDADLDVTVPTINVAGLPERATLREIIDHLQTTYCKSIGVERLTQLEQFEMRNWLRDQMESTKNRGALDSTQALRILTKLTDAEIFEQFLAKNFVGEKRFSAEGAESFIAMLDMVIEESGTQGVDEIVIGMAHRGRPERAGQRARQEGPRDLRRVRRQAARALPRGGRRQVPPRVLERPRHAVGQPRPPHAELQPEPPRVRQPRGRGARARQAGPRQPQERNAAARARRRRHHGPGRRRRDAQHGRPRRLRDGRHHARRRQQRDRLHDHPRGQPQHRRATARTSPG